MWVTKEVIEKAIATLPAIKFRQEKVFADEKLEIYNDTTATSPEATIAALEKFCINNKKVILIAGGTDRELDFSHWGEQIKKFLTAEDIILLSGSATEKMKKALKNWQIEEYDNLEACLAKALNKSPNLILFSPGAKSFEKFKNEFDRGEQFNVIIKKLL